MKRAALFAIVLLTMVSVVFMIAPSHAALSVIKGTVYWFDQYGNLRPLAWAQVGAVGEFGDPRVATATTDGTYIMWLPAGTYNVTASLDPGYIPQSYMVTVPDGGVAAVDFQLEQSGVPIPEYPPWLQPVLLVAVTLATLIVVRRRLKL